LIFEGVKKIVLGFFFSILLISTKAQTSVYHPFPDSNATWCIEWAAGSEPECDNGWRKYELNGKISNKWIYIHRIFRYEIFDHVYCMLGNNYLQYATKDTTAYYIRQDTALRKVLIYDGLTENVLYDFNLKIGDTLNNSRVYWADKISNTYYIVSSVDSVLINGTYRKRINYLGNLPFF